MADRGVEAIAGIGLVKLGKWWGARQKDYRSFIVRIQKMIVGVTRADEEERKNDHTLQKALLGYDPGKWVKTDVEIRGDEQLEVDCQRLEIIQPIRGTHIFAHCQVLYEEVHAFFKQESGRQYKTTQRWQASCGSNCSPYAM